MDRFLVPRPRRTIQQVLASSRETGLLEFMAAIQEGKIEKAKLISSAKRIDPDVCMGTNGETALHVAARTGQVLSIKYLMEEGADVNKKEQRGKFPLHIAASYGQTEAAKQLIEGGASLDVVDKFGRSPLMWATTTGSVQLVKVLLDAGASVASQSNWHALHEACKAGLIELVKHLIDAGAPVNNPKQYVGCAPWSPLHIAVRQGHMDCVKLLLDCGANVSSINAGGHTPLHEAAYRGHGAILLSLLRYGATVSITSNQKRTALHEACMQGKVSCALKLLDSGSFVNAQDLVGEAPLHLALRANHAYDVTIQITTLLLSYGASQTLAGKDDEMPLDIIKATGQEYCLEVLQNALETPLSLLCVAKIFLRKMMSPYLENVHQLPITEPMKQFLMQEFYCCT